MSSRSTRVFLSLALLAVALGAWALFSSRDSTPAPAETAGDAALTPAAVPPTPSSPIERFRKLTYAVGDRFEAERLEELLASRLRALGDAFRGQNAGAVFVERIEATPLAALDERVLLEEPGARTFEAIRKPEPRAMAFGEFLSAFRERLASVASLQRCKLKLIRVSRTNKERLSSTVLCRFAGDDARGGRHQWNASFEIDWNAAGDESSAWRVRRLRLLEWNGGSLARAPFVDVSARALGGNACYEAQFLPSVDYFRDRLDAAIGMDVYGHHGIAVGDLDGDGLDDLYVPEPPGLPNRLLRNAGDGTFVDVSAATGADLLDAASHALILDADNDGDRDLFVVGGSAVFLLRNAGGGKPRFTAEKLSVSLTRESSALGAVAADYDGDGYVDVYVTAYTFWRNAAGGRSRFPLPYHEARNGARNVLLRNLGDGRFEDATAAAGLDADNSRFTFAAAWGDFDGDRRVDLYVANDFGSNQLYRNLGGGRFEDFTERAHVADIGPGMSAVWWDVDEDGRLDLYVGNMFSSAGRRVTGAADYKSHAPALQAVYRRHARGNSLFRNAGDGSFEDISVASGAYFGRWAWSSDFVDANLDGRADIYVTNGFVTGVETHDL